MTRAANKGVVAGRVVVAGTAQTVAGPLGMPPVPGDIAAPGPSRPQGSAEPLGVAKATRASDLVPEPGALEPGEPPSSARPRDMAGSSRARNGSPQSAPGSAERKLELRIRAHLSKGELSVTLTDNRYTMISVRRENKGTRHFKVRLHHMFADAGPPVTRALARYIAYNDREASRILGEYIDSNQERVRSRGRRTITPRLVTQGRIHDLREIFDDLNRRYFSGSIDARITWGLQTGKPKRRNSIKMGSYSVEDRLIRIHRSLDRAFVPRFFVEWVVYHEMLHQVHDIKVVNGRRQFHSREFLRDEAKFEHYAAARSWERAHLDALLTC